MCFRDAVNIKEKPQILQMLISEGKSKSKARLSQLPRSSRHTNSEHYHINMMYKKNEKGAQLLDIWYMKEIWNMQSSAEK